MKTLRCWTMLLVGAVIAFSSWAGEDKGDSGLRLALDLADGSHIIGAPAVAVIAIRTLAGKVSLPLAKTASISFSDDNESVTATLVNGDRLSGVHDLDEMRLTTSFGEVAIPAKLIRELVCIQNPGGGLAANQRALIGHWRFDGDGMDLSGGGRHLKLAGDASFADGISKQALDLHGNGKQFAVRPIDDKVYNFGASDFTIQVWVNFKDTRGEQTLIEKFSGASGPGWSLTKLSDNRLHFFAKPSVVLKTEPISIPTDAWHNIWVRRTGPLCEIIYDGAVLAAGKDSSPIPDTTAPLLIGKRNPDSGQDFPVNGRIDDVAIWSRALSDAEISALIKDGNCQPGIKSIQPVSRKTGLD